MHDDTFAPFAHPLRELATFVVFVVVLVACAVVAFAVL
jgi:hypothetical protein